MDNWPSLEEMICSYNYQMQRLAIEKVTEFQGMFERERPSVSNGPYQFTEILSQDSFKEICPGRGFYLILSNYAPLWERQNVCTLTLDDLPVIYRGQANHVQERVRSHLDNRRYLLMKKEKGYSGWERSLKLDEVKGSKGGINFDEMPFNSARWAVVVLPMPKSTSQMREFVEWAFDRVFGKPVASNERKSIPHAVKTAIDQAEERACLMKKGSEKIFKKLARASANANDIITNANRP